MNHFLHNPRFGLSQSFARSQMIARLPGFVMWCALILALHSPRLAQAQTPDAGANAAESQVWKTKAIAEFPDLKNPQSPISRKLAEMRKAKAATPGYFSNPQWPYLLAKEASLSVHAGQSTTASARPGGIVLGRPNQLSQAQGGKSAMMADLEAILSKYGKPENDLDAHPDVTIYEGPSPGGGVDGTCRITYLMPRAKAESLLFRNRGIVSRKTAVAPGFPPGMVIHTYDIRFLIYNRFYLMVDQADQVVTLEFKSENTFAPGKPPVWTPIERDFSSFDYINTENRGNPNIRILTHVQRPPGASYIVVNMAATRINETTTWHVPDPLIRQILHHLGEDNRKGR